MHHLPAILDAVRPGAAAKIISVHAADVTDDRHGDGSGAPCGAAGDCDRTA